MSPLDIPRLNWEDFRVNPAVDAAYRDLATLSARTERPVVLHDRALVPDFKNSFRSAWSGGIHIFIEVGSPRTGHSLVHEILHEILIAERYCQITGIRDEDVRDILSNDMQHPEIFRRMEEVYHLEMDIYWEHWRKEMRQAVDRIKKKAADRDWWLVHFPRIYTWFFQKVSEPYLEEYAQCCQVLHEAAQKAAEETASIGFSTAEKHRRSIELFRHHWERFCEWNLPRSPSGPTPEGMIAESKIKPIIENDRIVTGDNLMTLLLRNGLRMV